MSKWQNVFHTDNEYRAKIVRDILHDSGLDPVIVNTKDRAYNNFGGYDVAVQPGNVIMALKIINDEISFE
jgi:hypothetical protein